MPVHYVQPIVFGVVVVLLVLVVLAVRAAQAGHPPRLSPGWATTITVVVAIGGFYLILRPDGRTDDVRVTEFLRHVPILIVGVIVIAALCVMVLARAFIR